MRSEPPRPRVATSPLGRGADEARHDRYHAAAEQGREDSLDGAVGAGVVRGRLAEMGVGVHQVHRVHEAGAGAPGLQRGGDEPRAQTLAAGDQVVGGARGELAQQPQSLRQRLQLGEEVADVEQHVGPEPAAGKQRPRDLDVARAEPGNEAGHGARLAAPCLLRHFQERIGSPRHRGDDHDGRLGTVTANDLDGVANGGGIGQRRTAELVHVWRAAGSGHGGKVGR